MKLIAALVLSALVAPVSSQQPPGRISITSPVCKEGVVVAFHIQVESATEGNIYINHQRICGAPS